MTLIPYVIEKSGREERAMDIYSRLLKDRIITDGLSRERRCGKQPCSPACCSCNRTILNRISTSTLIRLVGA